MLLTGCFQLYQEGVWRSKCCVLVYKQMLQQGFLRDQLTVAMFPAFIHVSQYTHRQSDVAALIMVAELAD